MTPLNYKLNSVFWELTRRCNLNCIHCRTGTANDAQPEMSRPEALNVAEQLVDMKVNRVVLTGGEPTLYTGWSQIAQKLIQGGVKVRLFTNGFNFTKQHLQTALDVGVSDFALSLDGEQTVHDRLRPSYSHINRSSFEKAMATIRLLQQAGIPPRIVTQVNRRNLPGLSDLYELLIDAGIAHWQLQLCQMTGRATQYQQDLALYPSNLEKVMALLLRAAKEKKINAPLHCTFGYMTREEPILRGRGTLGRPIWTGCRGGLRMLSITPNGSIKGCTTLPDNFSVANLSQGNLASIWKNDDNFPYTRHWTPQVLGPQCSACSFSNTCRAGCPTVAYTTTGSIGATPYCLKLLRKGRAN